ncbi:MAG: protein-disulfide reductase DsbD [Rhodocyclaceae bacterium]|jgi:thiol:disulfide interchange protein DsbD|nr:protein-disulfide reductase DsbD [Rhodocyclaceae bacterium]
MKPLLRPLLPLLLTALTLIGPARAAEEPLPPEQAFKATATALGPDLLEIRYRIAKAYYLYKDKFQFRAEPETVQLGAPTLPPGKKKQDEFFGEVETYRDEVRFTLPLRAPEGLKEFQLTTVAQGCADMGVCYPPTPQTLTVSLSSSGAQAQERPPESGLAPPPGQGNESSRIAGILHGGSLPLALATFFGFGLLMAFTPCTFPMIPILSGIIVGHGHHISRGRAFALSAAYVLGMALTYAAAGVAAGLSGTLLSAALQNAWVLGGFALVFVVLSLSMFGLYELQLPASLQSSLSDTANHQKGGRFGGVAAMGALSALIVGPCMAAPLAGALLYIAKTGDATLGGLALFAMALGMGVPLMVVGVAARTVLPKAGPWMEGVKQAFGVILLGVAIWLVTPVVPALVPMLAWAGLLIFSGIFLHALDPLPPHARGAQRFGKACGVVALIAGAAILLGALAGSRDPLQPLVTLRAQAALAEAPPRFERVADLAALEGRLASAERPVLLDFYADWCVSCKEMERFTFSDPQVAERMKGFVLLKADVTANTPQDKALLARFGLFGPPGILFFNPAGKELEDLRVVGFQQAAAFLPTLDLALAPFQR